LLLPVLSMLVWAVVVGVPAARMWMQLRSTTGNTHNAEVGVNRFHMTISPQSFLPFAVNDAVVTHSHALTAMYLPGALVEMPFSLATTAPEEWYPRRLDQWTVRALILPVHCLPAWWLVGLGLETLLGRRRLRWPALLLGTLLCVGFFALEIGLRFAPDAADVGAIRWVFWGFALWTIFFAALPAAWWRQAQVTRAL
jgi:hypothetical protein